MDIQQLRYVDALAKEKHFGRAAQHVNVTQPTLSQQVQKLEKELGCILFERSSRSVELTKQGQQFLPYARRVLTELRSMREALSEETGQIRGVVKLGVIPTICPYIMPEVLQTLSKQAPLVSVELYEETTSILVEDLKSGKLDIAVLALPLPDKSLTTLLLHEEPLYVALSKHNPLSRRDSLKQEDLQKQRLLILQEGHCFGQQSVSFCKLTRQDPQVVFQGSSLASVMAMAQKNQGITLVPRMAAASKQFPDLRFIEIQPKQRPMRQIAASWRMSAHLDSACQKMLDVLKDIFDTKNGK